MTVAESATLKVGTGANGWVATAVNFGSGAPGFVPALTPGVVNADVQAFGGASPGSSPTPHNNLQPYLVVNWIIKVL